MTRKMPQRHTTPRWIVADDDSIVKEMFNMVKRLGKGAAGEVFMVQSKDGRRTYACKVTKKRQLCGSVVPSSNCTTPRTSPVQFQYTTCPTSEAVLHSRLSHPNIVSVHRVYETPCWIYMLMDAATHGALIDVLVSSYPRGIPEAILVPLFASICRAVEYLHSNGIAHRDIKPDNILVFYRDSPVPEWRAKLCDFGAAKCVCSPDRTCSEDRKLHDYAGTLQYAAPEVLNGKGHGLPADLWSLGVTLYVLLCGHMPFYGKDHHEQIQRTCEGEFSFPESLFARSSHSAIDLVQKLLVVDVDTRCTISDVLSHPWFQGATGAPPQSKHYLNSGASSNSLQNELRCQST